MPCPPCSKVAMCCLGTPNPPSSCWPPLFSMDDVPDLCSLGPPLQAREVPTALTLLCSVQHRAARAGCLRHRARALQALRALVLLLDPWPAPASGERRRGTLPDGAPPGLASPVVARAAAELLLRDLGEPALEGEACAGLMHVLDAMPRAAAERLASHLLPRLHHRLLGLARDTLGGHSPDRFLPYDLTPSSSDTEDEEPHDSVVNWAADVGLGPLPVIAYLRCRKLARQVSPVLVARLCPTPGRDSDVGLEPPLLLREELRLLGEAFDQLTPAQCRGWLDALLAQRLVLRGGGGSARTGAGAAEADACQGLCMDLARRAWERRDDAVLVGIGVCATEGASISPGGVGGDRSPGGIARRARPDDTISWARRNNLDESNTASRNRGRKKKTKTLAGPTGEPDGAAGAGWQSARAFACDVAGAGRAQLAVQRQPRPRDSARRRQRGQPRRRAGFGTDLRPRWPDERRPAGAGWRGVGVGAAVAAVAGRFCVPDGDHVGPGCQGGRTRAAAAAPAAFHAGGRRGAGLDGRRDMRVFPALGRARRRVPRQVRGTAAAAGSRQVHGNARVPVARLSNASSPTCTHPPDLAGSTKPLAPPFPGRRSA